MIHLETMLRLLHFLPLSGPENTLITINGSNFSAVAFVEFGGLGATFNIINDNEIEAVVPIGAVASANISMTSSGGCIGNASNDFTVLSSDCVSGDVYISEIKPEIPIVQEMFVGVPSF